jgi:hypothetical protein
MSDLVIELVLFRTKPDVTENAFLAAADGTTAFLQECPGFLRRRLARGADGEWLDHVEWRSMKDALDAAARIGDSAAAAPFMAAIEPSSVTLRHFTVRSAADPAMQHRPAVISHMPARRACSSRVRSWTRARP